MSRAKSKRANHGGSSAKKKRRPARGQVSIPARGSAPVKVLRTFNFSPKQWTESGITWLSKLLRWGSVIMKVFTTLLTHSDELGATWTITDTVQTLFLGPEDLLWSSPIREDKVVDVHYHEGVGAVATTSPAIDYRQAKIAQLRAVVSVSAESAKRGGTLAVALLPLSLEETVLVANSAFKTPSFDELLLMPGCTSATSTRTLTRVWSPRRTDAGSLYHSIGSQTKPTPSKPSLGGAPTCVLIIGYRNWASSTADPTATYAPEEAMITCELTGTVNVREWGESWIRTYPYRGNSDAVQCKVGGSSFEIPASCFTLENGVLVTKPGSLSESLQGFISLQMKSDSTLGLLSTEPSLLGFPKLRINSPLP